MGEHGGSGDDAADEIRSLARFPDENPHPVLRLSNDGAILYANAPSGALLEHWDTRVGGPAPPDVVAALEHAIAEGRPERIEASVEGCIYAISVAPIAAAGYANLYCQDITDQRAAEQRVADLAKFPDENPNPVMRISATGNILYANVPCEPILTQWGAQRGGKVPDDVADALQRALRFVDSQHLDVVCGATIYGLELSPVPAAGYANVYGRDVTRQKQAEAQLIKARDQALEASRSKSAFLANMSHELRTPMNAIIGYSEMLLEEAEDLKLDEFVPDLGRIHGAGRHLLHLINDILDLSKIEAGRMSMYLEDAVVSDLIELVTDTARPLATKNDNRFDLEVSDAVPVMHTDVTKLKQILLNLLGNAFKFTKAGRVKLEVGPAPGGHGNVRFAVTDDGVGMTPEQIERIYGAFTQADDTTTREYGGTGLGLAITKRFCEMLGGNIMVESTPGEGSTFTVTLPARSRKPSQAADRISTEPVRTENRGPVGRDPVLVVDDDEDVRELIRSTLVRAGFNVVTCARGDEALELARTIAPIAITLDVIMPEMDGWSVLTALKSDEATRQIPVIMVSISDDQSLGMALGATEFMTKPLDRARLVELLDTHRSDRKTGSVLIVDDEEETRELLRRSLTKGGWTVTEACDGRDGLDKLEDDAFDVVVLDLMMPVMDGFQFLEKVRNGERWRELPIIVVTARELADDDRRRLDGSVAQVLSKGDMPRDMLLSEVQRLVRDSVRPPPGGPT